MTKDFFECAIHAVEEWTAKRGMTLPSHIVIAEPLAMESGTGVTDAWLSNYRACLRRIVPSHFDVDFIPEPFAAFQYYRYGVRHPLVAEKRKHIALVVDFGGGTFDVCIIETTKDGDIKEGGRNSRPISAHSLPIGGFYANRMIAEHLLFAHLSNGSDKSAVRRAIEKFYELNDTIGFDADIYADDLKNFFRCFSRLLRKVEAAKLHLCGRISNWDLAADLSHVPKYPIEVPLNPFSSKPQDNLIRLDAMALREVFENRIWKQRLRDAIRTCIKRASEVLKGQPVSVVLLSGGSANIRWLKKLIERDVESLRDVHVVEMNENFQEVVAKGLAIECARRFYSYDGSGDFKAVTYNQLCTALRSDDGELEMRPFKPASAGLPVGLPEGVLLDSALSLTGLIDAPLIWKFKMSRPPSRFLDYFFMNSSFDPEDLRSLQNIDHRVHTPAGTRFGSRLQLELTIREDGTTIPKFVYGTDQRNSSISSVEGKPFYLEMTFGSQPTKAASCYLGFDFGSSNSSFSLVSETDVSVYVDRAVDRSWLQLNDLVSVLPYPAAAPVARFMAETSRERMDGQGREAVEGILCVAAYIAYAEWCAAKGHVSSAHLKGMAHRSASPLWALLKRSLESLGDRAHFAKGLRGFLVSELTETVDSLLSGINNTKHGMISNVNFPRDIGTLGNVLFNALKPFLFGSFESVVRKSLYGGFTGIFRAATGSSPPFIDLFNYTGSEAFPDEGVYLVDAEESKALQLSPLMIRLAERRGHHLEDADLWLFDKVSREATTFKAVQVRAPLEIRPEGELSELHEAIRQMTVADQPTGLIERVDLTPAAGAYERE